MSQYTLKEFMRKTKIGYPDKVRRMVNLGIISPVKKEGSRALLYSDNDVEAYLTYESNRKYVIKNLPSIVRNLEERIAVLEGKNS